MMPLICSTSCRPLRPHEEHLQQPEGDHEPWRHGPGRHPQLLSSLPAVYSAVHAGAGGAAARLPHPQRHQWPQRHGEDAAAQLWRWILEPECRIHSRIRLLLSDGLSLSYAVLVSVQWSKRLRFVFCFFETHNTKSGPYYEKTLCTLFFLALKTFRWIGGKYTSKWKWLWLFLESLWVTHTLWIIFDFQTQFFLAWTEASFHNSTVLFSCVS